jgi:hypothetical protein
VLHGSVVLKNFTISGMGSKKLKDATVTEGCRLKIEMI